ncbi:hypothetical protein AB0478_36585 [Streptomyces sp. NPDC051917]|uniref:hypothetical protein n=1 Tax=Streptomyces sp. NPDC051917 TaxID=3154754 RepID=UPI00344F205D
MSGVGHRRFGAPVVAGSPVPAGPVGTAIAVARGEAGRGQAEGVGEGGGQRGGCLTLLGLVEAAMLLAG